MGKPEIRFKGYTDEWEQRKLGDVLERRIEQRQQSEEYPRLAFASGQGVIPLSERKTNNREQLTKDEYTKKYLVTELNDIVYNPANVKYGAIDRNKCRRGLISPIYVTFTTNEIPGFIERIVTSHDFQQRALRFEEGTVTKRQSVNPEDLVTLDILVAPKREEQQKIATYFDSLDHLITLQQRKCDEVKSLKKYMLQKMFPQNEQKVPEIRFEGFTEAWEQRKLGELVKEGILEAPLDGNHGEKHPTSDEYVESGIPFLMASDIHNGEVNIYSCKYITKERAERLDKGFARNGDVLLTHKATIGETAILSNLMTEYAMLTPQVTYYRIKNEERLNREYLYSFFNSLDFQTELKTKAAQSTRPYIGITAQQNLKIILPTEIDEQRKIGLYFGNLDRLITLHQQKCEELKKIKKFMLQKMFV